MDARQTPRIAILAAGSLLVGSAAVASSQSWGRPPPGATAPVCNNPLVASRRASEAGADKCDSKVTQQNGRSVSCADGTYLRIDARGVEDWCYAPPAGAAVVRCPGSCELDPRKVGRDTCSPGPSGWEAPGPPGTSCQSGYELRVDAVGVEDWCYPNPPEPPKLPSPTCPNGWGLSARTGPDTCGSLSPQQAPGPAPTKTPTCPQGKVLKVDADGQYDRCAES